MRSSTSSSSADQVPLSPVDAQHDATGLSAAKQFLPVLVIFAVLYGVYQLLLQSVLAPASYSENNAHSAVINLQATFYDDDEDVALVGSSISARFLEEFFDESGLPIMGLGLDAQGPALGIDLLLDADRVPPLVAVEINRSLYSSSGNEETVNNIVSSPGFALADRLPGLRAESRPSSILYTELKQRADGTGDIDSGAGLAPDRWFLTEDPEFELTSLNAEQQAGAARIMQSIDDAMAAGACITLYIAPDNGFAGPAEQRFTEHLSYTYGVEVIDLRSIESEVDLDYTDAIHLDIASARLVSHVLADTLVDAQTASDCR